MKRDIHPLAGALAAFVKFLSGVRVRWLGSRPELGQRIYFANHTSHLDAVVIWAALPRPLRARARPVAAKDYWSKGRLRPYLAARVFRAVLVERRGEGGMAAARGTISALLEAVGRDDSLIVFPEGTRGTGDQVAPFKSGIYHLCRQKPEVELVPVYLDNMNRILPKGEVLPVPLLSRATFGPALSFRDGESKDDFLSRAREALLQLKEM